MSGKSLSQLRDEIAATRASAMELRDIVEVNGHDSEIDAIFTSLDVAQEAVEKLLAREAEKAQGNS